MNKKILLGCKMALIGGAIFMSSCKPEGMNGPELKGASSSFQFLDSLKITSDKIKFLFGEDPTIGFSAIFSEEVSWELNIEGVESGATKVFQGVGGGFKEDEVVWDGRSSSLRFYKPHEKVVGKLTILGIDSVFTTDTITTNGAYYYHTRVRNGIKHIVIDHFEKSEGLNRKKVYNAVSAAQAPDQADNGVIMQATTDVLVEGNQGYYLTGTDVNNNGWCGSTNNTNLLDFLLVDNTQGMLIDSGIRPEELFFNMYIYGTGKANSTIELKVYELDAKTTELGEPIGSREALRAYIDSADAEGVAVTRVPYDQGANDGWIYDIEITWTGWKLVSVPYSQFRAANDLLAGGNGDRVKESWRIGGMAMSILSYPQPGETVEAYVDLLTITLGGRFQQ